MDWKAQLYQLILRHLLDYIKQNYGKGSVEGELKRIAAPTIYGAVSDEGLSVRQGNLFPRPNQVVPIVTLEGDRIPLGDTPRLMLPIEFLQTSSAVMAAIEEAATALFYDFLPYANPELLSEQHNLGSGVLNIPSWVGHYSLHPPDFDSPGYALPIEVFTAAASVFYGGAESVDWQQQQMLISAPPERIGYQSAVEYGDIAIRDFARGLWEAMITFGAPSYTPTPMTFYQNAKAPRQLIVQEMPSLSGMRSYDLEVKGSHYLVPGDDPFDPDEPVFAPYMSDWNITQVHTGSWNNEVVKLPPTIRELTPYGINQAQEPQNYYQNNKARIDDLFGAEGDRQIVYFEATSEEPLVLHRDPYIHTVPYGERRAYPWFLNRYAVSFSDFIDENGGEGNRGNFDIGQPSTDTKWKSTVGSDWVSLPVGTLVTFGNNPREGTTQDWIDAGYTPYAFVIGHEFDQYIGASPNIIFDRALTLPPGNIGAVNYFSAYGSFDEQTAERSWHNRDYRITEAIVIYPPTGAARVAVDLGTPFKLLYTPMTSLTVEHYVKFERENADEPSGWQTLSYSPFDTLPNHIQYGEFANYFLRQSEVVSENSDTLTLFADYSFLSWLPIPYVQGELIELTTPYDVESFITPEMLLADSAPFSNIPAKDLEGSGNGVSFITGASPSLLYNEGEPPTRIWTISQLAFIQALPPEGRPYIDTISQSPTELDRELVSLLNPYIAGTSTYGPYGWLANPLGVKSIKSQWGGIVFTEKEYCADVFRDDWEEWYVVLVKDGVPKIRVSHQGTELGEWLLSDIASQGLNDPIYQHYNFAHPNHPFDGRGRVGSFIVRKRQAFDPEHSCPIVLEYDSAPRVEGELYYDSPDVEIESIEGVDPELFYQLGTRPFDPAPLLTASNLELTASSYPEVTGGTATYRAYICTTEGVQVFESPTRNFSIDLGGSREIARIYIELHGIWNDSEYDAI